MTAGSSPNMSRPIAISLGCDRWYLRTYMYDNKKHFLSGFSLVILIQRTIISINK
jgi:hypothetical protein